MSKFLNPNFIHVGLKKFVFTLLILLMMGMNIHFPSVNREFPPTEIYQKPLDGIFLMADLYLKKKFQVTR